jgi:hypothetical protein
MGLACGVWISFTPLLGFHFLAGWALAWFLRGDVVAMGVGTITGNPWTFPLMWYANYHLGKKILMARDSTRDFSHKLDWATMKAHPVEVLLPLSVGGAILGLFFATLTFFTVRGVVASYQIHRQKRLMARRQALSAIQTMDPNNPQDPTE